MVQTAAIVRQYACRLALGSRSEARLVDVLMRWNPEVVGPLALLSKSLKRCVRAVQRRSMRTPALVARERIPAIAAFHSSDASLKAWAVNDTSVRNAASRCLNCAFSICMFTLYLATTTIRSEADAPH